MYAIKIKDVYVTNFSEYMHSATHQIITFPKLEQAEEWAQSMELGEYEIINLNEGGTGDTTFLGEGSSC